MITKLIYNWHQVGDNSDGYGEDYDVAQVGYKDTKTSLKVRSITGHQSISDGGKWYYDVFFTDGTEMRIFNPNIVVRETGTYIA